MFSTAFTRCAVNVDGFLDDYDDGPYTLAQLAVGGRAGQFFTIFNEQDENDTVAAIWIPEWKTWEVWYNPGQRHADYPHDPGQLYDCQACEASCFCGDVENETECVHCAIESEGL